MQSNVTYNMRQNDNSSSSVSPWAFSNATLFKGYWKAKKTDTNHQVLIKSQQNWLKQGEDQLAPRFINLLTLSGIRGNCLRSERSQSLHLSIRRMIKQTVLIIQAYYCANYVQKFIQHPAIKVNSICRGNYWGS